jgi:spermidine/putrescine transport system permease protein
MMKSKKRTIRWTFVLFFTPVALWLLLLIVLPHIELLRMSFLETEYGGKGGLTFGNYLGFFSEPIYWRTFIRTAVFSFVVTLIVLALSLPLAFYVTKVAGVRVQGFLMILILLPFWVSELIRVYGWMIILRESGVLNAFMLSTGLWKEPIELLYNDAVMIMGLVYTTALFMVVPLIGSMESLDDPLIEAAFDLGAKKFAIWKEIIIPWAMPGIMSGSIVVFMIVLGSYLTPKLMGGTNSLWFTEQIYNQFITYFNWNQGSAFGFLLLLLSSGIIWVVLKLTGQKLSEVVK